MPASVAHPRQCAIGLALVSLIACHSVSAQTEEPSYSDAQLKAFAAAQADVVAATDVWDERIDNAPADRREPLSVKEERALVKAVTDHGLTPTTYNAIATQAQDNPKLTRRIQHHMAPRAADAPSAPATDNEQGADDGTTGG